MINEMRDIIKKIPFLGILIVKIYRKLKFGPKFISSKNYWEGRYKSGGNSGDGSYNNLAKFKADIINSFVVKNKIKSILEIGCGDGNQLKLFNFKKYKGLDVSSSAIKLCNEIYKNDKSKSFDLLENMTDNKFDMVMSLDVIYHLVENDVYENYMKSLFKSSSNYVIIYSSNFEHDSSHGLVEHVKHRKFTDWIDKNIIDFKFVDKVLNKYPYDGDGSKTSYADFYIFQKV